MCEPSSFFTYIPELAVTEWLDRDVLPERSGVYEVDTTGARTFRYFDGTHWYSGSTSPRAAEYAYQVEGRRIAANRTLRWRGITERAA